MSRHKKSPPNGPLRVLLKSYVQERPGGTGEASIAVEDLAFHDPETFWDFIELALATDTDVGAIRELGPGALTWLLRKYPDEFVERVAGAARRDERMRQAVEQVQQDRVAPDVWGQLETAVRGEEPEGSRF